MKTTQRTMGQMTRRMIVQYAGVVQDFNPVHYDEQFARAAGLPNVIAQGPLTVALALDALVAEHGSTSIRSLSFRLKSPVFPGDTIYARTTVTDVRASKSRPNQGIVTTKTEGYKADGTVFLSFERVSLVPRRGAGVKAAR
ncbi:MAG: MaoC family dehydratase [Acetobacteraceae bacterium]|nr:MaoC family dehydratase [Acetobacteraceae bacterium]